jgi:hypothetical protein
MFVRRFRPWKVIVIGWGDQRTGKAAGPGDSTMSVREKAGPDLAEAVKHRIVQRTAGRIHNLEVELVAARLEVRGQAASFHVKQLAIQGALEEVNSSGIAQHFEIDVKITVLSPNSVAVTP